MMAITSKPLRRPSDGVITASARQQEKRTITDMRNLVDFFGGQGSERQQEKRKTTDREQMLQREISGLEAKILRMQQAITAEVTKRMERERAEGKQMRRELKEARKFADHWRREAEAARAEARASRTMYFAAKRTIDKLTQVKGRTDGKQ
jgi:hypothetical protein